MHAVPSLYPIPGLNRNVCFSETYREHREERREVYREEGETNSCAAQQATAIHPILVDGQLDHLHDVLRSDTLLCTQQGEGGKVAMTRKSSQSLSFRSELCARSSSEPRIGFQSSSIGKDVLAKQLLGDSVPILSRL